jgi:hypothetical protein
MSGGNQISMMSLDGEGNDPYAREVRMNRSLIVWSFLVISACTRGEAISGKGGTPESGGHEVVTVGPGGVSMPLGRVLLARKGKEYCAVKFLDSWTGKTEQDWFARYESYYQGDGSGDFVKDNVEHRQAELSSPEPKGIGRLAFSFGNTDVVCGPIRMFWSRTTGKGGTLYCFARGQSPRDYGIELAPTKWTRISDVVVSDRRLKWYRYDDKRGYLTVPIDDLWPE